MALPAPAQPPPPRQAKGPPRHADAGGYAMTAPMTRADLEVAVSKLATKEEVSKLATKKELAEAVSKLATKEELRAGLDKLVLEEIVPLREDMAALKVKVDNCATKEDITALREAQKNFATKADLSALSAQIQREMRLQILYMLGGIGALLALFQFLG